MFRGKRRFVVLALTAFVLVAGTVAWRHHKRYKNLVTHDPGRVYRSAWLEADAMAAVVRTHGVRTVVNLCEPDEMGADRIAGERAAVASAGGTLVELTMPTTVHANDPAIARHLALLSDEGSYPILVHCQHGVTRTAKFLAIYDIACRGMTAEESFAAQPTFGRVDHNVHVKAFARNFEASRQEPRALGHVDRADDGDSPRSVLNRSVRGLAAH